MDALIGELLRRGLTGRRIAQLLGLSETQVSLARRRLGEGVTRRRSRFDWPAIRAHYEAGHSLAECMERFGFSGGAWTSAVARGDIVPTSARPFRPLRSRRRELVGQLLADGLSQSEIARRLGLSRATVCYYARRLGVPVDAKCARRYDWAEVQRYYDAGHSITECQQYFGFARKTAYDAVRRGALVTRPQRTPIEQLCVAGTQRNGSNLRRRLIAAGLKEAACEACGIDRWRGVDLTFELHHVNGNRVDNRIENLRILCPNCHSQTENWGGRKLRAA